MRRKLVVAHACTHASDAPTRGFDARTTLYPDTTPRMTTTITTPTDDESYPTPDFDSRSTDGAPLMFSPTSTATAGQFDTEADDPR